MMPPRLAGLLLRRLLPPEDAEVIAGDLEEMFHAMATSIHGARGARRWYWRQVISVLWAHLRQPSIAPIHELPKRLTMPVRQDFLYAARSLRKQPALTMMVVLMLALGIGANVAIFALVNAVLLEPLPYRDPARLAIVHMLAPAREAPGTFRHVVWSYPKYSALRDEQQVFESTAAFIDGNWNLTGSGSPERVIGEMIESTYFHVLGVSPRVGRLFTAEETRSAGSVPLAILGYGFWSRRFGADESLIGKTIGLNGVPHTVVGILPLGFKGLTGQADVWVPVTTLSEADLGEAWNHAYTVVARRKGDVSIDQAEAAVKLLGARIDTRYPSPGGHGLPWGATVVPLNDERADPLVRRAILLLLTAVASVLLLVCLNVGNLMLARGLSREREVAIRLALGANRIGIVRQFMTESVLLAGLGALAGLLVAYAAVWIGASLLPDLRMVLPTGNSAGLTRVALGRLGLDASTLLFAVAITMATAVIFGLGPALGASRRDLSTTMKAGASGAVSPGTRGLTMRNALMVAEVALALVLLTAGGLMMKSVQRLQAAELGFRPDSLLTVRLALPGPKYNRQSATRFLDQLLQRLEGLGRLGPLAYGSCPPLSGACNGTSATFPDRPPVPRGSNPSVGIMWASPRYFETLGIRLVRGRFFTDQDRAGQPKVAIINETAARQFWKNEDAVGRRIAVGQGGFEDGAEIVGVVADVRYRAIEKSVAPDVYLPLLQSTRTGGFIFVRAGETVDPLVAALRAEVQAMDPDVPLTDIKMMGDLFGDATWRTRVSAWLLGAFSALALLLAALGIYGVMSQGVEQRRREIGVRMALGAARADILKMIIVRVIAIAAGGIAIGIALAIPSMRVLSTLLYQVTPGDPIVFATLACVLLAAAVLAGYVPARRAARVDPLITLRAE